MGVVRRLDHGRSKSAFTYGCAGHEKGGHAMAVEEEKEVRDIAGRYSAKGTTGP